MPASHPPSQASTFRLGSIALLSIAILVLLAGVAPAPVRAGGIVVVKPSALAGWTLGPDSPPQATGSGSFVAGPGTPPGGSGSVQLTVDATGSYILGSTLYNGIRLDQLSRLDYSTYRASGGAALAPSLQLNVDYNLADANTAWQGRLIFEPYLAGAVSTGVWQSWGALGGPSSGSWWATGAPGNGVCPQANPCTTAELLATFPNLGIHATLGAILFKAGPGWSTGFTGSVDRLIVGLFGDDTVFDFEPETPCTTLCYVNGSTGDDSYGGDTPGSAKRTIGAALAQVSPGGTVVVAAGAYPEAVTITKGGVTLRGAGSGSTPATSTIISGPVGSSPGVLLPNSGTTGVTIRDLRVQGFSNGGICSTGTGNDSLRVESVAVIANAAGASCLGGIAINGPVANVTISGVLADSNTSRGIVIAGGFKRNITIANSTVTNNNCCGIELSDGTASGVTITGNTVTGNADSGIAATGLRAGAGPNLIANNTLTDNGRLGIELRLPDGSGAESGDGSVVVRDNSVRRVTPIEVQRPSELRDLAGIAVIRRSYVVGAGNVDIPAGVVVKGNTVSGYQQSNPGSASEGFGIVAEGLHVTVAGNTVSGSDVGIQTQAGHLPYAPGGSADGDQSNLADQFFGRGNSPAACVAVGANTLSGNGTDTRSLNAGAPTVTNQSTGRFFCTLQSAIDDPGTLAGHTIVAGPRAYPENLVVGKGLTLRGANAGVSPNSGARGAESSISPPSGRGMVITAGGVTVDGFRFSGISADAAIASGAAFGGDASDVALRNNLIESSGASGIVLATPNSGAVSGWTIDDNLLRNLTGAVTAISVQRARDLRLSNTTVSALHRAVLLDATDGAILAGVTINRVDVGVLLQNGAAATLSGLQLDNSGGNVGEGVGLDIAAGSGLTLNASVAPNLVDGFGTNVRVAGDLAMTDTTVSGGIQGLLVQAGAGAVTIGNSSFAGQLDDYITLDGYPDDIEGRAAFFAGVRGDALSPAQYAAAQAKITDANDTPSLGRVVLTLPLGAPLIVSPAGGAVLGTARPTIAGTADPGATVTVLVDGAKAGSATTDAAGGWSLTLATDLPDGGHTVLARATDALGNTSPDSPSTPFTIDTAPPDTTIVAGPPALMNTGDAAISFAAGDPGGAGVLRIECALDGGPFSACTSPRGYTGLAEGAHTFQARAVDLAGNADPAPATHAWVVDLTAPTANIPAPPAPIRGAAALTFTVSYADGVAVRAASLAAGAILVAREGGPSQQATLLRVEPAADGPLLRAIYEISAPGGAWDAADSGRYTVTAANDQIRDAAGNALAPGAIGSFVVSLQHVVLLPLVAAAPAPPPLPDLVVERIAVAGGSAQVTIRNQGRSAATAPFWVDVYVQPRSAPSMVNQVWQQLGDYGAAWGVTAGALPLAPGASLTLTVGDPYYRPDLSRLPERIAAGTPIFAQVDSANVETAYGAVLETHERDAGPYNNVLGAPAGGASLAAGSPAPRLSDAALPPRPTSGERPATGPDQGRARR